jgi:hypothetical protein
MADLATLKRDLGAFARAVGRPRTDWQLAALRLLTRLTMLCAGRQLGKSESLALVALWRASGEREHLVLIISASDQAARRLLAEAGAIAHGSELLRDSVVDQQRGLIRLTNGSMVRSVAASEAAVRGWSVDTLLCDEAALQPGELLVGAALPTMAARPNARAVLASSATVASGPFFDLFRAGELGDEHIRSHRWVAKAAGGDCDAPWIAPSSIEVDRAAMSGVRFAAEHQAMFGGAGDSLFTLDGLARCTVDYEPDTLATMRPPATVLLGCDWGAVSDRSAVVAIGRLPIPGRRVFGVRMAHRWRAGHPLPEVYGEIARSPGALLYVASEINGMGAPCTQELFAALERRPFTVGGGREAHQWVVVAETGWDPTAEPPKRRPRPRYRGFVTRKHAVTTSAASKAATFSMLRLLVDKGQLLFPASATDLIRELQLLRVDLTPGGGERIGAPGGGNDDMCDALYLSAIPVPPEEGAGWSSALAQLADARRPLPEVQVPPQVAESPHVPGPDGMTVPARPAWQSVKGDALTVPEGLESAGTVDPRLRAIQEQVRGAIDQRQEVQSG